MADKKTLLALFLICLLVIIVFSAGIFLGKKAGYFQAVNELEGFSHNTMCLTVENYQKQCTNNIKPNVPVFDINWSLTE